MLLILVLTVAAGLAVPAAHAATDWSMFRGPNASGISNETDLPVEFGPGKNMVWKTELPPGHSSPVFGKDSIFLTGFRRVVFSRSRSTARPAKSAGDAESSKHVPANFKKPTAPPPPVR